MKVISESTTIEEVAALVSESLSRAGITAVLSGGGAVQIYSNGLYVSRDLDFVSPAPVKEIAPSHSNFPLGRWLLATHSFMSGRDEARRTVSSK